MSYRILSIYLQLLQENHEKTIGTLTCRINTIVNHVYVLMFFTTKKRISNPTLHTLLGFVLFSIYPHDFSLGNISTYKTH